MKFHKDKKGNISAENIASVHLMVDDGDLLIEATDEGGCRWCLAAFTSDGKLCRYGYLSQSLGFRLNKHNEIKLEKFKD